ncbi:helix-turn-helix domain-containing protein [Eubacteriales bacterium OttesenSCG-928-A19]|nr:helix-turn-helix domain-containing protein [Eubacteriales bacterium OttesenSCG-928-A19]
MKRLRTIDEAYREIHEHDPRSCITKTALRNLVISGEIPSRRIGVKYLLTLEAIERYFSMTANSP